MTGPRGPALTSAWSGDQAVSRLLLQALPHPRDVHLRPRREAEGAAERTTCGRGLQALGRGVHVGTPAGSTTSLVRDQPPPAGGICVPDRDDAQQCILVVPAPA